MKKSGSASSVFIIDRHPSFRFGLKTFINEQNDFFVAGEENDLKHLSQILEHDLIILNPEVSEMNGRQSLPGIMKTYTCCRFLIATDTRNSAQVHAFMAMGAAGYISKEAPIPDYLKALKIIADGGTYLPEDMKNEVFRFNIRIQNAKNIFGLTTREIDLLQHLVSDLTNKELADKLGISVRTVETHKRNIRIKCRELAPEEILGYMV